MTKKILPAACFIVGMAAWGNIDSVQAEPRANHRVTLTLSGENCSAHHEAIAQKLYQVPGVVRVNMQLIEDHIMIDRVQDERTAEDFLAIVNGIIPPDAPCRAEIMGSCISAGPITPSPAP